MQQQWNQLRQLLLLQQNLNRRGPPKALCCVAYRQSFSLIFRPFHKNESPLPRPPHHHHHDCCACCLTTQQDFFETWIYEIVEILSYRASCIFTTKISYVLYFFNVGFFIFWATTVDVGHKMWLAFQGNAAVSTAAAVEPAAPAAVASAEPEQAGPPQGSLLCCVSTIVFLDSSSFSQE